MSDDVRKFLTAWPVLLFTGGIIFSSGMLWANFTNHVEDGHPRNLSERIGNIENDVRWIRNYLDPSVPPRR